jgi:hypothetical protein
MEQEYDFAAVGKTLLARKADFILGHQAIRPFALDALPAGLGSNSLNWTYVRFASVNRDMVPTSSGVYHFLVHPRAASIDRHTIILYFGRARHLQTRFNDYLVERGGLGEKDREHVVQMLTIYRNRIEFGFAELDYYKTELVEDLLIDAFRPCCNRAHPNPLPAF